MWSNKASYSPLALLRSSGPTPFDLSPHKKFKKCLCEYCVNVDLKVRAVNSHLASLPYLCIQDCYQASRMTLCPTKSLGQSTRRSALTENAKVVEWVNSGTTCVRLWMMKAYNAVRQTGGGGKMLPSMPPLPGCKHWRRKAHLTVWLRSLKKTWLSFHVTSSMPGGSSNSINW